MKSSILAALAASVCLAGCNPKSAAPASAEPAVKKGLPVALCAAANEVNCLRMDVTVDARITTARFAGKLPSLADLDSYSAIVFGRSIREFGGDKVTLDAWCADTGLAALEKYVQRGGAVIVLSELGGDLVRRNAKWAAFLGVSGFSGGARAAVSVKDAKGRPYLWADGLSICAKKALPGAEVLATAEFRDGSVLPVAVRRKSGQGFAAWFSMSYASYDMYFSSKKKVVGEADDKGVFVLTADGESQKAMRGFLRDLLLSAQKIDTSAPPSGWGLKPLGEKGDLNLSGTTLPNKPVYRAAPVFKPVHPFQTAAADGVIVAPTKRGAVFSLACEVQYHIGRMTGRKPKILQKMPKADVPAIVIGDGALAADAFGVATNRLRRGESILKRKGAWLLAYGRGSGQGYAVTYLLESLGCRYLWPGKSGKVIPKRSEIVLPELALDYVPAFKVREMRDFKVEYRHSAQKGMDVMKSFWGIDTGKFKPVYEASLKDQPFNRGFWQWHGVNDGRDTEGDYSWGHYFGDYWKKYGESHPDWFALQPNGTRYQDLGDRPERPTLCLSNPGFIEQTAQDAIAAFKANPGKGSFSLCLPDGGHTSQCMCENCRKWDPPNAAPNDFYVGAPWWRTFPYVALSDRVMRFNNAVAERVVKECPRAKFSAYIYSMYTKPVVRVKPHPALVLMTVAGSVADTGRPGNVKENVAAWSQVAHELMWRPNTLFQFSVSAPQNYGRKLFDELECLKVNKVVGTDFDCVNGQFANKGLMFYTMCKAHRNPDCVAYDDWVADYCKAGFGAAADEIARYFAELERMTSAAIKEGGGSNNCFLRHLDIEALAQILDAAEAKAAGDAEVLARVAYLKRAIPAGRIEKKLGAAWDAKSRDGVRAAQRELCEYMTKCAFEEPAAVNPIWVTGTYHSPNMKSPNF